MGGLAVLLVYLAIFIGIIYLLVVLPQRRIRRQQSEMMGRLSAGDEVVTTGGIYGTITELEDGDTVLLEIAEDTEIRVAKNSVARIIRDVETGEAVPDPADGTTE